MDSNDNKAKIDWITIVFAVVGFGVAVYAFIEHISAKSGYKGQLSCDINATISCSTILTSEYGEIIGIPLGAFGMAFWGGIFIVGLLPKMAEVSKAYLAFWRLLSATMGFLTAVVLAYIAYVVLKGVCIICGITQVMCVLFFVYAFVKYFKEKHLVGNVNANAFMRMLSAVMVVGSVCVLCGLIVPPVAIDYLSKKNSAQAAPTTPDAPLAVETPIPSDLLKVAKSNYVGKGEDYRMGNDSAKLVIHMFTDPECPACRVAAAAFDSVFKTIDMQNLLFVVHFYPIDASCNPRTGSLHPHACALSLATRCAGQQQKFWDFLHWAYSSQTLGETERSQVFSEAGITKQAQALKLNMTSFKQCVDAKVEIPKIQEDIALGDKLKLTGTPLIIMNGKKFSGNHSSPSDLMNAIQQYLDKQ